MGKYTELKETLKIMLRIIESFDNVNMGEINDLEIEFDFCKNDLIMLLKK